MKISLSSGRKILGYLLIYFLLLMNGSTFYRTNQFNYVLIVLLISLLFVLAKKASVPSTVWRFCAFIIASIIFVFLINSGGIGVSAILSYCVPIIFLYVASSYNGRNFCIRYVNTVTFIAALSLVYYAIANINSNLLITIMPFKYKILSWLSYYGDIFYVVRPLDLTRNCGLFNEPGLYQMVLNSAIFIMMFYRETHDEIKNHFAIKYVILTITLISTMSTTGYIGFIIIMIGAALKNGAIKKEITIILFLLLFIGVVISAFSSENLLYSVLASKLSGLTNVKIFGGSSGSYRTASILISLKSIVANPLGCGFDNLEQQMISAGFVAQEGGTTATGAYLFRYIAIMGIVPGVVTLIWLCRQYFSCTYNRITAVVAILLFLNTTLAQTDIFFPALLLPIAIDLSLRKRTIYV